MTTAQDLALNLMLNIQARENFVAVSNLAPTKKERKLRSVKVAKEKTENQYTGRTKSAIPGMVFTYPVGSVDAKGFMKLWRTAKDRNEQIQAINAYTGFDNRESFAVNEYRARSAAQKELAPHRVTAGEQKTEGKSHVAGVPDYTQRKIQDLLGREKMAAESLSNYELQAANLTEGSTEQLTALGMVEIERERLIAIRNDLKLLVK